MSPLFWLDKVMSELREKRPAHIRPEMSLSDRAKQFAPFAALGRLDRVLKSVEEGHDTGDPEHIALMEDLSEEELAQLAGELPMEELSESGAAKHQKN